MLPPTSTLKMEIKYPSETLVSIYERSNFTEDAVIVKFTLEQATKAQNRSRGITLPFL
jgi:hypothetical protein